MFHLVNIDFPHTCRGNELFLKTLLTAKKLDFRWQEFPCSGKVLFLFQFHYDLFWFTHHRKR